MASIRPGAGLVSGEVVNRGFSRIVMAVVWLIITPSVVLLALGILMLVFNQANLNDRSKPDNPHMAKHILANPDNHVITNLYFVQSSPIVCKELH